MALEVLDHLIHQVQTVLVAMEATLYFDLALQLAEAAVEEEVVLLRLEILADVAVEDKMETLVHQHKQTHLTV